VKKIKFLYITAVLSVTVLFFSCGQDPIFWLISKETIPIPPRIPGSPTNMVLFQRNGVNAMYVASGNIHWYSSSGWDTGDGSIPQPGGRVTSLAVIGTTLYALCLYDGNTSVTTRLRSITNSASSWVEVPTDGSYPRIQVIYASGSTLFAGGMNNSGGEYGILYLNGTTLTLLAKDTGLLTGAAQSGNHYLSTNTKGIYYTTSSPATLTHLTGAENLNIEGMFLTPSGLGSFSNKIIAVERDGGRLYFVDSTGVTDAGGATGNFSTGALAIWTDGTKNMLVAGKQGALTNSSTSSYSHGYVEFELDTSTGKIVSRNDPPTVTTFGQSDQYTSSIGKLPVNYMYQAQNPIDTNMTFFASTQAKGLWSFRKNRDGGPQWNAEGSDEP